MAESLHSPSGKAGLPPGALVHVGAQPQTAGRVTLISYGPDHCTEREVHTVDDILAGRREGDTAWVHCEGLDIAPLLSEIGELLLWSFAPDLPHNALAALHSGHSPRSIQAQVDTCGFRFKDLTLKCATIWHLPPLLTQFIRGIDNTRANLSRLCVDTARHILAEGSTSPALPSDIAEAKHLIPGASLQWLTEQLPGLDEEQVSHLVAQAEDLLDPDHH